MKKLLRNIALLLLPIVLYFTIFILFEPNNYFNLRDTAYSDDIIARLREFQRNPGDRIILGESRLAKMDGQLIYDVSGKEYTNLAFAGASFPEQLDLLEWSLAQNPNLKEVLFGLSFYTVNKGYAHDRMVVQALNNPFVYMTNLTYNINMLENLSIVTRNLFLDDENKLHTGGEGETMDPADYVHIQVPNPNGQGTLTMREDLYQNAQNLMAKTADWQVNQKEVDRLLQLAEVCHQRGIEIRVVFPPMEDSVRQLITIPMNIEPAVQQVISSLRENGVPVIDYEFETIPPFDESYFFDGFHMDLTRGLGVWTKMLFEDLKQTNNA